MESTDKAGQGRIKAACLEELTEAFAMSSKKGGSDQDGSGGGARKNTAPTPSTTTNNKNPKARTPPARGMGSLLKFLRGTEMVVELKTGKRFRGVLEECDDFMNIELADAVDENLLTEDCREGEDQQGDQYHQSDSAAQASTKSSQQDGPKLLQIDIPATLSIRGPKIRYIQFPDNVDLNSTIIQGMDRERAARNKYKRGLRK